MNDYNNIKKEFLKRMSGRPIKQLQWLLVLLVFLLIVVAVFAIFPPNSFNFWKTLGSFFSPVPMYSEGNGYRYLRFLAYLFGTVIISGVVIALLTNFIRTSGERYINGTASLKFKDHILFLGYDEMMICCIKKELDSCSDIDIVVAVPSNVPSTRNAIYQCLSNEQSTRVFVVQTSRTNVDDLKDCAQVLAAKRIYIIGQEDEETHDAINLKCLGLVIGICMGKTEKPTCFYYMRNHATFSLMQRQGLEPKYLKESMASSGLSCDEKKVDTFLNTYCVVFNFYESVARRLMFNLVDYDNSLRLDWHDEENNLAKKKDLQPHFVIIGMTEMGTALAKMALMTNHFPKNKLKITFVDENAYMEMHYFIGRYDGLFDNCRYEYRCLDDPSRNIIHSPQRDDLLDVEFEFLQGDVAHPKLMDLLLEWSSDRQKELLTMAVCTNDAPKNMAFALYLARPVLEKVSIWVYQKNSTGMDLFLNHSIYKSVNVFSLTDIAIPEESIEYKMAKYVAHTYDVLYGKVSDWSEKTPIERWSSLYSALSIIVKMRLTGYGIRLVKEKGRLEKFNVFNKEEIEEIRLTTEQEKEFAASEHSRWNIEKLMNGFIPTTELQHQAIEEGRLSGEELKAQFIHDNIRPFNELSESEREKDVNLTESLINMINNS